MAWQQTLALVLQIIHEPLEHDQLRWAVIGSAASALQGCAFTPADIDLLTFSPEGAYRIAQLMLVYAPPQPPSPLGTEGWCSSHEAPINVGPDPYGFVWHFSRWYIANVQVEAAHIKPPAGFPTADEGAGIWEAGAEIWPYIRTVAFAGYQAPVVPLEIQLQTNRSRERMERVHAIERVLQANGYDRALLQKSLAREYWNEFQHLL